MLPALIRCEILKLKRTLALWMVLIAPLLVGALQVMLWLNRKDGWEYDVDLWKSFASSILSIWAIFMSPLFTALVVALVYQHEHATNGWLKMFTLPVPAWSVIAAKQIVSTGLTLAAAALLVAVTLAGGLVVGALHPNIDMPTVIPVGVILQRSALVFLASLAVIAVQNWVSLRWSTLSVALGVGIGGTFVALFATSWKYGYLYPWLMPLHALNPDDKQFATAVIAGSLGGILIFAASLLSSSVSRRL